MDVSGEEKEALKESLEEVPWMNGGFRAQISM